MENRLEEAIVKRIWLVLGLALAIATPAAAQDIAARVANVLAQTPLIDGHNDSAVGNPRALRQRSDEIRSAQGHLEAALLGGDAPLMTDIPRLRAGHVGGQFWSVFVPTSVKGAAR